MRKARSPRHSAFQPARVALCRNRKIRKADVIENLTDADGKPVEIKQGVRIQRWTFVIDKEGKIAFINKKVNAAQDAKSVAEVVEKLK